MSCPRKETDLIETMNSPDIASGCMDEDAALARSLQLVADMEFAEAALAEMRLSNKLVPNGQAATQSRAPRSGGDADLSRPLAIQCVPMPPPSDETSAFSDNNALACNESARRSSAVQFPTNSRSLSTLLDDGSATNKSLLYVPCEINDRLCEMMVDTGASTSVISEPLLKKLNLENQLNTSRPGIASGVGKARILGRIESFPIKIGHAEFFLHFSVLESSDDMLILGIDQMRRFNCLVDLQRNKLIFGGQDGVEIDFFTDAR